MSADLGDRGEPAEAQDELLAGAGRRGRRTRSGTTSRRRRGRRRRAGDAARRGRARHRAGSQSTGDTAGDAASAVDRRAASPERASALRRVRLGVSRCGHGAQRPRRRARSSRVGHAALERPIASPGRTARRRASLKPSTLEPSTIRRAPSAAAAAPASPSSQSTCDAEQLEAGAGHAGPSRTRRRGSRASSPASRSGRSAARRAPKRSNGLPGRDAVEVAAQQLGAAAAQLRARSRGPASKRTSSV